MKTLIAQQTICGELIVSTATYNNISPVNQQKHLLIILLNGSKNVIRRKNRLCRNGETRMEIQDQ